MDDGSLRPWAISGGMNEYQHKVHAQLGEPLFGQVVKSGRPARFDDLRAMARLKVREVATRESYISAAAVSVTYQGRVLAVMAIYADEPRRFREAEIRLMQLLANQGALAIENARRMERLTLLEESLRLSERFALLGTLAAEIAHEIRNPITIINLLMHSIQESPDHNTQTRTDLATIMSKLERINQIIEQTLSLSKTSELHLTRAGFNKLVEDLLLFLNYKLSKGQIKLQLTLDPKVPEILMDPGQVQQVLLNLIVNAMQAMPDGGELRVKTRVATDRQLGQCVRCTIQDTGVGMEAEVLKRLFDPFYTTREGGTGLGLFISNKLIRRHNGHIRVKSTPGRGSSFTITMPVDREEATE
jgi:signal transduction histidine kinase